MKFALRTGAGLTSLLLTLFVAGTMTRDQPARTPQARVGGGATTAGRTDSARASADGTAQAAAARRGCGATAGRASLFAVPFQPRAGQAVRLVAVSREQLDGLVAEVAGASSRVPLQPVAAWGPGPFGWEFATAALTAGDYTATVRGSNGDAALGCIGFSVTPGDAVTARVAAGDVVWPVRRAWDGELEDFYSVWVARLFRVPEDSRGGWHRLHAVFRSAERNVLFAALGWGEDELVAGDPSHPTAIRARADCGDLPYVLRAYFAWKLELPFRFQRCNRRNALLGAECYEERSNLTERFARQLDPVERFNRFVEAYVASGVHSATPRTLPEDQASDFYPVPMTRAALRPGTVYVWPYGHLLVITDWRQDDTHGLTLVAVDGHPDGTVTFKHFSPENFPYLPGLRTAGFKTFRPVVFAEGEIRPVDNAGVASYQTPLLFSEEQYRFRRSGDFYRAVEQVSSLFIPVSPGT